MSMINLPGLWLDNFVTSGASGLLVANRIPEPGDIDHGKLAPIVLEILCTNGSNVDTDSTLITIEDVQAYDGASGFINGWSGTVTRLEKGLALLADWRMEESGTAAWTAGASATLSKQSGSPGAIGSQVLQVAYGGAPNGYAYQDGIVENGQQYRVRGWTRGDGTAYPTIQFGGTTVWTGDSSSAWQAFDFTVTSSFTGYVALKTNISAAGYTQWDDVSIRELGPDYRWSLTPPSAWESEQLVEIKIWTQDDGGPVDTLEDVYQFTVEDYVEPLLLEAFGIGAQTARVTFSEGMLAVSPSGENDALNPANYSITFIPAHALQSAVSVTPTAVAAVTSSVYDVTTDIELTFFRRYSVTCGDIADDSANANLLHEDYRSREFNAWVPPSWPATRRFDIWEHMLAQADRDEDASGDLRRFCEVLQDIVNLLLWDLDSYDQMWDIDRAAEPFLDAQLQGLGNPHLFPLTVLQKRKLMDLLVSSYRLHGTAGAIVSLVRFFLGIHVTVYAPNKLANRWVLGGDILGEGTVLGPSGVGETRSFVVQALQELTDQQRIWILRIAEVVKQPQEHVTVQDPTDAVQIDHWVLGYSKLGEETVLH